MHSFLPKFDDNWRAGNEKKRDLGNYASITLSETVVAMAPRRNVRPSFAP